MDTENKAKPTLPATGPNICPGPGRRVVCAEASVRPAKSHCSGLPGSVGAVTSLHMGSCLQGTHTHAPACGQHPVLMPVGMSNSLLLPQNPPLGHPLTADGSAPREHSCWPGAPPWRSEQAEGQRGMAGQPRSREGLADYCSPCNFLL